MDNEEEPKGHLPKRPSWTCDTCGKQWPCAEYKDSAMAEHRISTVILSLSMGGHFMQAQKDLGGDPTVTHERFMGWCSHRARSRRSI